MTASSTGSNGAGGGRGRRVIRMSPAPAHAAPPRVRPRERPVTRREAHLDPHLDLPSERRRDPRPGRRPAPEWRRPDPAPQEDAETDTISRTHDDLLPPADDAGWLLGGEGGPGHDAVTEALPHGRRPHRPRRRRRRFLWPGIALLLVLALGGGVFFARDLIGVVFPADYDGPGTGRVVVEVRDGASTRAIGEALVASDVVASSRAFGDAAEKNPEGRGIQPGFYELRHQMSAADAVTALLDPATRVGRLDIRSGTQLDDTVGAGQSTVPGVLSLISRATCTVDPDGNERCASVDDLRTVMATTDPAALGVPSWALAGVARADPNRRLEGLLAPGPYDIAPGTGAREALEAVVRASASRLEAGGLVTGARAAGVSPYDALIIASLTEKEGVPADFGKVSRVIYNRLAIPMRLQFDSTINYPLDRQQLLTTPFDRATPGTYNTYLNLGLPPTPIAAVSPDAMSAALDPAPGTWVYFVKCQLDGISCFAVTPEEHDANRRLAQERGVY